MKFVRAGIVVISRSVPQAHFAAFRLQDLRNVVNIRLPALMLTEPEGIENSHVTGRSRFRGFLRYLSAERVRPDDVQAGVFLGGKPAVVRYPDNAGRILSAFVVFRFSATAAESRQRRHCTAHDHSRYVSDLHINTRKNSSVCRSAPNRP